MQEHVVRHVVSFIHITVLSVMLPSRQMALIKFLNSDTRVIGLHIETLKHDLSTRTSNDVYMYTCLDIKILFQRKVYYG